MLASESRIMQQAEVNHLLSLLPPSLHFHLKRSLFDAMLHGNALLSACAFAEDDLLA